jgi:hypothetical protein
MAEPTPAGDVYSLAATVYALLRGCPPQFPDDGTQLSLVELIVRHTWPYPDLPRVPAALNSALRHALASDPAQRLSDAGAFRDALAAVDLDTVDLGGAGGFGPAPSMTTVPSYRDAPLSPYTQPHDATPPYGATPPPPSVRDAAPATVAPGRPGGGGHMTAVTGPGGDGDGGRKGVRRPRLIAVLAAVAVSVSVSVTVVTYQNGQQDGGGEDSPSAASPSSGATAEDKDASGFGGVVTTRENCPATGVDGVGGRCVATAECWSGITDISGIITISRADCQTKHVWETFAIAPLPEDGMTNNARDLIKHPDVKALCSPEVMAESVVPDGRETADEWNVDILPPTAAEWDRGLRVFRCVAAAVTEDGEKTGSQFVAQG